MAATSSRRRSSHGLATSGSSTQLARKGSSSGKQGGNRGRFDPTFMMSSNAVAATDTTGSSPHDSQQQPLHLGPRRKSSDRLHRPADSSNHLGSKRSKSYTHLGVAPVEGSSKRRQAKKSKDETEDGWTSASGDNTLSDNSAGMSSSSSPMEDDALVVGIKKRPPPVQRTSTITTLSDSRTEASLQQPDTPRVSAGQLPVDEQNATVSRVASILSREDTSMTLTNDDEAPAVREPTQALGGLENEVSALRLRPATPPSHSATAAGDLGVDASHARAPHDRAASISSNRTLRTTVPAPSSPGSIRSRLSLSSGFLLYPRETQAAAPPQLDTHNALAGRLGSRYEDRGDLLKPMAGPSQASRAFSALSSSTSAPTGWNQRQSSDEWRRKANMSSLNGSGFVPASPSASVGDVSHDFSGPANRYSSIEFGTSSQHPTRGLNAADRHRTASTQSLTATDAAKLAAKLRLARDTMDDMASSGYHTVSRGQHPRAERYRKPIVSTFAKNDPTEAPQAIEVQESSVYSSLFSQPHDSKGESSRGGRMIRYVMRYGLSGPPIEKSKLSDALLGPSLDLNDFESSWAPALANAAGLGAMSNQYPSRGVESEYGLVAPDATAAVGGPNSTPLHLIHGLTTTSPDPFPLDPSDVPALQEEGDIFGAHRAGGHSPIQYVDPSLIRAIAITTQAIATHRSHVVTRRYADPMREGMERVARSSGRYGKNAATSAVPSSVRWGRKSTPNSPIGSRSDLRDSRPSFERRSTSDNAPHRSNLGSQSSSNLAGQLYTLVDAAEHPVRSIKRVWSGGLSRGGLAALTRTEEES